MDWKRIAGACAALVVIGTALMPILRSDASPWSSITRVESVRSDILTMYVSIIWKDYCEAVRMNNQYAAIAVSREIQNVQVQYAKLNDNSSIPLRPCP